jgi:hypothetical protein
MEGAMAWYEKPVESLVNALTAETIGRALILAIAVASIATLVPLILLNEITRFAIPPQVKDGHWFTLLWFGLLVIVTGVSLLMSAHDADIKLRTDAVTEREDQVKNREAAVVVRETEINKREADDLLTGFREQMVGIWEMTYLDWVYDNAGHPKERSHVAHARFELDRQTAKLQIRLDIKAVDHFRENEEVVSAIIIWPVKEPQYLAFYHQLGMTLDTGENIIGAVFSRFDIKFHNGQPVGLHGTWYDLDRAFSRVQQSYAIQDGVTAQRDLPPFGRVSFKKLDVADQFTRSPVQLEHAL